MAKASDASVKAARDAVISSAEQLRDAISGSFLLSLWDPEGPERKVQQKNLTEAIDKLKQSKDTESIKKNLLYLQATIDVSKTFYGNNDANARAFAAFIKDVENAPALLIEKVIAPVVKGAAEMTGKTLWAAIKGLWPILLLVIVVAIGYGIATRRFSK
jgi:hypothetical protein